MGHNVGDAAANAVKKSERKAAEVQTPAQLIDALRKNYRANLYIPMHQIGALLTDYDAQSTTIRAQYEVIGKHVEEKQVMTDTIFGLTQRVQELEAELKPMVAASVRLIEEVAPGIIVPADPDLGVKSTLDIKS